MSRTGFWVDGVHYGPSEGWKEHSRLYELDKGTFLPKYKQRRPTKEQYLLLSDYTYQFRNDLWEGLLLVSRVFGVSSSAYKNLYRAHQRVMEVRSDLEDLYCKEHGVDYRDSPFNEKRATAASPDLFPPFL